MMAVIPELLTRAVGSLYSRCCWPESVVRMSQTMSGQAGGSDISDPHHWAGLF
jgi:hypothetical protein